MNGSSHNSTSYFKQVFSGFKALRTLRLSYFRKVFSLMGKWEKIIVLLLFALAIFSAVLWSRNYYYSHTSAAPANGGGYAEGVVGQPTYINPLLAYQEPDLGLLELVYSGLYKHDSKGEIVADLAEGMPVISEDQKQYVINLKRGVKWHNDKSFTADDVVFTIQTLKDPAYKSPLRNMWMSTEVEKLSDYSVKFTTRDVSGPFLHNLTLRIMPQAIWSNVDAQNFLLSKRNLEAIGTGPLAIKEIKKLPSGKVQSLTLESFAAYYGNKPRLDSVAINFYDTEQDMLNAFHSKEIAGFGFTDLGNNLSLEKNQEKMRILSLPLPQYQVAFFNLSNKFLAEQPVRQALALATDKEKIIKEVFKDKAILPVLPGASDNVSVYDKDKAVKLLEDAGWKLDQQTGLRAKKNSTLELTITTNDSLPNAKAAENLANQWRALNVKVNLTVLSTKQLTDAHIRPRNFDVLLFPLKYGADPDPFPFWHSSQSKDPGLNLTGFSDQNMDRLITDARTTTDQNFREEKYREFNALLAEKAPAIFLNQTLYVYAISKDIKNVGLAAIFEPGQRFTDLPNWYVAEKRVWK